MAASDAPFKLTVARALAGAATDLLLSATDFRVFFVICSHINSKSHVAWPSQKRLCDLVGVGERALRDATRNLREQGYLSVETPGRRATNRYRLATLGNDGDRHSGASHGHDGDRHSGAGHGHDGDRHSGAGHGHDGDRHSGAGVTGTVVPPILSTEPIPPISPDCASSPQAPKQAADHTSKTVVQPTTAASLWTRFEIDWRWHPGEARDRARRAFGRLSTADAEAAIGGIGPAQLEAPQFTARQYLINRAWACARAMSSRTVAVELGSPQWAAWLNHKRRKGEVGANGVLRSIEVVLADGRKTVGSYFASEWPPGAELVQARPP